MVKLPSVSTHSRPKAAEPVRRAKGHPAGFQHTAARRRLLRQTPSATAQGCFNTQPPEGGCSKVMLPGWCSGVSTHSRPKAAVALSCRARWIWRFQHTAARRRLTGCKRSLFFCWVSTHSRPKAAGPSILPPKACCCSFNTQPPEGGWDGESVAQVAFWFQHTAARRRLGGEKQLLAAPPVSTHSRPKAAGCNACKTCCATAVSTHSRPKAADPQQRRYNHPDPCFNTQPPEGGCVRIIWPCT